MKLEPAVILETAVILLLSLSVVHYAVVFYSTLAWRIFGGLLRLFGRKRVSR